MYSITRTQSFPRSATSFEKCLRAPRRPCFRDKISTSPKSTCSKSTTSHRPFHSALPLSRETPTKPHHDTTPINGEDWDKFRAGSHPWLRVPYSKKKRASLEVHEHRVPNGGLIQVIRLNEPDTLNALSQRMVAELGEEVELLHEEPSSGPSRAVVLASNCDRAFCAGANLKERARMNLDEANFFLNNLRHTLTRLSDLPIPSISAIHGLALGGGLELALATTLRVISATASVGQPETGLGIVPGAGGTYRLPHLIGHSRALEIMLTARRVGAREALDLGIVNAVAEYEQDGDPITDPKMEREMVLRKAVGMASVISLQAPLAVRAVMRAVRGDGGEESENEAYESVIRTRDRDEALAAFREKRMPVFRGE